MRFRRNISFAEKTIGLEKVVNARDLGGYTMSDGRKIKKGRLLRGGSLAKATDEDLRILEDDFRVAIDFDFRTQMEVKHSPDRKLKDAQYLWLPTIDESTETVGKMNLPIEAYRDLPGYLETHAFDPIVKQVATKMYTEMVRNEYTQLQYAAFLLMIQDIDDDRAVYWHCSQGKDRTGLGAAFILAALGADRNTIMEDFEVSNNYYRNETEECMARIRRVGGGEEEFDAALTFIGVNSEYFENALDIIDKEYGSMDDYLRNQLILRDKDIEALRDKFLE